MKANSLIALIDLKYFLKRQIDIIILVTYDFGKNIYVKYVHFASVGYTCY